MSSPGPEAFAHLVYARSIPLATRGAPIDPLLEAGKRHNLTLACAAFDGVIVNAQEELSFWGRLGRAGEEEGYREGIDMRGGCLFPSIGGGLCLLSNALFELGAQLGWRIVERHGHLYEGVAPPRGELWGLDARVLFPYVDLRVAPEHGPVRLTVRVGGAGLLLGAYALEPSRVACVVEGVDESFSRAEGGWMRENRIRRRIFSKDTGALVADGIIAENARRLVTDDVRRAA